MLSSRDPLPREPRRILVAGTSGSGKSTLARRIAGAVGVPYEELDALRHGPDWQPRATFALDVEALIAQPAWVTEWQYPEVRQRLAQRADLLVWLDFPRAVVMSRVVRRTVARRLNRTELWNGNVEAPLRTMFTDRDHIIRWAWRTHATWRSMVADAEVRHPHLMVVRLGGPAQADDWINGPLADMRR
ncbi:AAA family ATPase [Agromyces sp. SYSU K20354]|nr:AAA family ATPase [Agromyces cavernae]MCD2441987.1 AAA family ATPase [Agromyces cavernae]